MSEHQPEPVSEAGCEEKVSRSVSWTALGAGFAELMEWCGREWQEAYALERETAVLFGINADNERAKGMMEAFQKVGDRIVELSGCEERMHAGVMDNDFNGPSS